MFLVSKIKLITNICAGVIAGRAASVLAAGYDIIIIEETETPLGAGPVQTHYYLYALLAMALLTVVIAVSLWASKRDSYVKRLKELNEKRGENVKVPFRIKAIKEAIKEAEFELTASML